MNLFRVENLHTMEGLWFCGKTGEEIRLVDALNLSNKKLPMPPTTVIGRAGLISAAESIEQLKFWFTLEDLQKLKKRGFELSEYQVRNYVQNQTPWYTHPLFHRGDVISRTILDINILK
jgi:hypothetical protein